MEDYSDLADCGQCSPVILSKDVLNNLIVQTSRDHPHFAPIYRAVRDDGVGLAQIFWWSEHTTLPRRLRQRGLVVTIADDLPPASRGPNGFRRKSLRYFLRIADRVCIHATGAQIEHYQAFADHAIQGERVLVIETQPQEVEAWFAFIKRHAPNLLMPAKCLLILPTDGVHPDPSLVRPN